MLLTAKSQAHGKLRVCRSARVLFLTLLGTIMYRMISIASFNQTYRLIHSYATFFLLAYTLGNMHVPFFFRTTIHVHLCICAESCHRASARTKYTKKKSDYSKSKHDVLVTLVIFAPPAACRRRRGGGGGRSESDVLDGADGVEEEAAI